MELTYSVTTDDVWRFSKLMLRQTPGILLIWIVYAAIVPVMTFFLVPLLGVRMNLRGLIAWAIMNTLWLLCFPWIMKINNTWRARQMPGLLGVHHLRMNPTGLIAGSGAIQSSFGWEAVERIWDSPMGILFFISKLNAVIVPLSAFTAPNQREQFVTAATGYWRHVRFGDPLPPMPESPAASSTWPPAPSPPASPF